MRYSTVMIELVLIAHNLRSTHNVGSLLRTADGLGVKKVYLTGYTPFPKLANDPRLPHLSVKIDRQIHKTALGAEYLAETAEISEIVAELRAAEYKIIGLEQDKTSTALPNFRAPKKLAIIVGREVEGLEPEILALCDQIVEVPMLGQKESYNVAQAAAMALYHCQFASK